MRDAVPDRAAFENLLPRDLQTPAFDGQSCVDAIDSSYKDHGYGVLLYALARVFKPRDCVELGVYRGFSLLATASALRDNGAGAIVGYDLFDRYPYRHDSIASCERNIAHCGLQRWASAREADAFAVADRVPSADWLHVDISNDGETYRRVFAQWSGKARRIILLEGGSGERDRVDWMRRYAKPPIAPVVGELRRAHPAWRFVVLSPYPSLTVAVRTDD